MTKLLQRVDVSLRSFYIFNSKFGNTDGEEHKKIVYYYPDDIEVNTKIKDVGLSEAIIAFTSNFTEANNDCKALHTQKTTQVFFQPEPDYWMVIVLNVPKEIRSKDGIEVAEYRGGEVHERIYRAVLEQCYNMFRIFNGTFQMNYMQHCSKSEEATTEEASRLRLQQKLTSFYDKHIATLKLPACNIMDMTKSLHFLALQKQTFLIAHNFVNTVLATFPTISEAILLYKENIVCSGKLAPFDLYYLHKFIIGEELLSKLPITETSGAVTTVLSRSDSTITECYRNGAFITNLIQSNDELGDTANAATLPKLYIGKSSALEVPYYLIVYRALDALMCLLISTEKVQPTTEFYDEIHTCMGPKLASISRDIAESINSSKKNNNANRSSSSNLSGSTAAVVQSSPDTSAGKFLFIDERSFKHFSNIIIDRKRPQLSLGGGNMPSSVLQLIVDLDEQDEESASACSSPYKESILKATNDFWIFKRSRNWRKYYAIIFNNKSTLLDVTSEAMRIFEQEQIDDVFF